MSFNWLNPYFWGMTIRNFLYEHNFIKSQKIPCPVISIGNISCGGTGKTSLIKYLAEHFSKEYKVGILLRGYKRKSKGYKIALKAGEILSSLPEVGDEAYMLASAFNGNLRVNIVVCEDKAYGGFKLYKDHHIELLLLDDGFQHRKLERDIDLVLLKKEDLKDRLLPLGRLREPLSSLKRATAIILTYQEISNFDFSFENKPVFKLHRKNWHIKDKNGEILKHWQNMTFIAFCGLGDNLQFYNILIQLQIPVKEFISFPDHYAYENLSLLPQEKYLTTFKDYVKLPLLPNLYYLDFEIEVPGLIEFIQTHLKHIA